MKLIKVWLGTAAALLAYAASNVAMAVPLDNRLPGNINTDYPRVDFTDIAIEYKPGRTKKRGQGSDTTFFGESTSTSVFTLMGPGYDGTVFDGTLIIDAFISPKGTLKDGSTFEIRSTDPIFNFGTEVVCNKKGNNCQTQAVNGAVLAGDLTAFGWSGTEGILEFETHNLFGWTRDTWSNGGPLNLPERLFLDVGPFDLNDASSVHSFTAMADGWASVPVPAAVWLFGSGLLGLVGMARRRQQR